MKTFRSYEHDIYTEVLNKVALSHADDKRYIIPFTTKTLPWRHANIEVHESGERNLKILLEAVK